MIVSAIAAMSRTGVIGDGIKMPWHLPRDLRRFRDSTMGKPVIMGVNLLVATIVITANLLTDLAYCVIDPRISYS